jgi:hypothetical protein
VAGRGAIETKQKNRIIVVCRAAALGHKQPLSSLAAEGLVSATSGRLDHHLGEGSMACIRFTLSRSWDQSYTKSSAVSH